MTNRNENTIEGKTNIPHFGFIKNIVAELSENTRNPGPQGFTNQFELNQTCMVLIVVFVLLFMYKKEVMAMVNKYLK